ncbi:MAG: asparagine synthase (glutamine-hydrolyzing) [Clostridia bacterium]|nr:asparagine synthase (glutamine-hydrolyzing) [Clostridia bacterium]
MCGFCGFADKLEEQEKKKIIKGMADRIIHRGPDSEGYYTDDRVAMGFRRLSIIDLAGGNQPIFNEDKSVVVMFNGEIYNFMELREELKTQGHIFTTNSDTEVIVHGYEQYGTDVFSHLRGMFGIMIYDKKKETLICARDFFGIKPVYYYFDNETFMVGSEIKSFLSHPNFKKELNKKVLSMYLCYGTNHMEETFFEHTKKLLPGHYLTYKDGKLSVCMYSKLNYEKHEKPYEYYEKLVKETLESSVEYHKISDVEVGSYLSGGVDSSYVVSVAKPNKTFTVGFEGKGFSEIEYAKGLSDHFGVEHFSKTISGDEFFDILPTVQYHLDEPSANVSAVPLYFLSRLARTKVKVVLSGEGADEMFGGYNEYNVQGAAKHYLRLPLFLRKGIAAAARPLPYFKGKNFIEKYGKELSRRYYNKTEMFLPDEVGDVLKAAYKPTVSPFDICTPFYNEVKGKDDVFRKMYIDLNFWLPHDILLKADKMSMANSVELRVPFLDKEVFALARRIPTKYLVRDNQTKYIFRRVAEKCIPEEWAKRRKLGFPVPFGNWIKEDKYYKTVKALFESDFAAEFFDTEKINRMLDEHHSGVRKNGKKIYVIYSFLIWYQRFFITENEV